MRYLRYFIASFEQSSIKIQISHEKCAINDVLEFNITYSTCVCIFECFFAVFSPSPSSLVHFVHIHFGETANNLLQFNCIKIMTELINYVQILTNLKRYFALIKNGNYVYTLYLVNV